MGALHNANMNSFQYIHYIPKIPAHESDLIWALLGDNIPGEHDNKQGPADEVHIAARIGVGNERGCPLSPV